MFTGASRTGSTCTMRPSLVRTSISQPTPQYGHVVRVPPVGAPRSRTVLSSSAPVGQDVTHAPQPTQELSRSVVPESGWISISSPRFHTFQTNCPCSSSQMRTHRKQSMHRDMSTWMYGCESSIFAGLVEPRSSPSRDRSRRYRAKACSSGARSASGGCRRARSASVARRSASTLGEAVWTTMPSRSGVEHDGTGWGCPSTATTHILQTECGLMRSSWQSVGTSKPSRRNASRSVPPASTSCDSPSTVMRATSLIRHNR